MNMGRKPKTEIVHDDASVLGLRYAAGKDYACTFRDISVAELAQRPMYAGLDVRRMQYWCQQDGWVEHRRLFREDYRKAMEKAIGTQLVQTRLEYMKRGERGLNMLFGKLVPEDEDAVPLEPTSLEGLANATRQFWDQVIKEKEKLADAIMPEPIVQEGERTLPSVRPQLSQAEARAAALTIVRMRREQVRAALKSEEEQVVEAEKPHMRVIDGEK